MLELKENTEYLTQNGNTVILTRTSLPEFCWKSGHDDWYNAYGYHEGNLPGSNVPGMNIVVEKNKEEFSVETSPKVHQLKSWPNFFKAISKGDKLHDLRDMSEHNFKVGDNVIFNEFDPVAGSYTGQKVEATITYITSNSTPCALSSVVLSKDYCILSIKLLNED